MSQNAGVLRSLSASVRKYCGAAGRRCRPTAGRTQLGGTSSSCADGNAGEVSEACAVGRDDEPVARRGCGGDDQVMGATRPAGTSDVREQIRVHARDLNVVILDGTVSKRCARMRHA